MCGECPVPTGMPEGTGWSNTHNTKLIHFWVAGLRHQWNAPFIWSTQAGPFGIFPQSGSRDFDPRNRAQLAGSGVPCSSKSAALLTAVFSMCHLNICHTTLKKTTGSQSCNSHLNTALLSSS